jgi:hypothetical protein
MSFIVYFHSCISRCHVDRHKPNLAIRYYFSRFGSPGTECTRFPHGHPLCGGKSINFLGVLQVFEFRWDLGCVAESNHQQPGGSARGGQFQMMVEKADHISYVSPIAARQCIYSLKRLLERCLASAIGGSDSQTVPKLDAER